MWPTNPTAASTVTDAAGHKETKAHSSVGHRPGAVVSSER